VGEPSYEIKVAYYFFLISFTSKGRSQLDADIRAEQDKITDLIRNTYGGTCELWAVPGPYDFISRVKVKSGDEAIQVQLQIESGGNVKALLLPGVNAGGTGDTK
jgi:uncharacterized protein with GYD domain